MFKKKKYKTIDDYICENTFITNFYDEDIEIDIELDKEQKISMQYKGSFLNLLGASFDMINGLITQYSSTFSFEFWMNIIENFETFEKSSLYKEGMSTFEGGKIYFEIDHKTQNINSKYSSTVVGFCKMISAFINDFCEQFNIDTKEYYVYYKNSYKYFKDGNYERLMTIKEIDD